MCFKNKNLQLTALSSAILWKKKANDLELEASKEEARYLAYFNDRLPHLKRAQIKEIKTIEDHFSYSKEKATQGLNDRIENILDTHVLGVLTVEFLN